jgi:divalent metal cation (Fe/Co/Zn/Cd) transporter
MTGLPHPVVAARRPPLSVRWRRDALLRRGLRLEYATLGWNAVAIGFLIYAAVAARSIALAGLALDSMIEIFASLVVVWQLRGTGEAHGERRAVRLIGLAFFGLAIYIAAQIAATLALGVRPDSSPLGIAWLAATCLVMLGLAAGKARTGAELGNPVLSAEAKVTLIDASLAAGVLAGLLLNALAGWWLADIAAGIIVIVYGVREGIVHLRAPRMSTPRLPGRSRHQSRSATRRVVDRDLLR